jgi:hypothetical protein
MKNIVSEICASIGNCYDPVIQYVLDRCGVIGENSTIAP